MRDEILSFVEAHASEQIQFVIDLCNQNSYTHNKRGVDRTADMIIGRLEGALPLHTIMKEDEIGDFHILRNSSAEKAVYLVGHMDTVFSPDHPFQKCRLEGDTLIGPGTGDMKGGLAVLVYALKALKEVHLLDKLRVSLLLNSDEEIGSAYSHSLFLEERSHALACLVAECAGLMGELVVSRNGKMGARIDCFGQDRHVAYVDQNKSSAILELAHKIISLEALNGFLPGVSLNAGRIEGGLGPSTVPAHAQCLLDVRWIQEEHREILLKKIQTELSLSTQSGCRTEMEILNSRPAMPLHKNTEEIFNLIHQVGRSLGWNIPAEHRRGTSDANFFGSIGVPTLDGLGPVCHKDHTPDESIRVSTLKERTILLALFLAEYGRKMGMIS